MASPRNGGAGKCAVCVPERYVDSWMAALTLPGMTARADLSKRRLAGRLANQQ
jgi:hypothetical protein